MDLCIFQIQECEVFTVKRFLSMSSDKFVRLLALSNGSFSNAAYLSNLVGRYLS